MPSEPHTDAEELDVEFRHPGGKLCPKCKTWNISEASMCVNCAHKPMLWRTEYKLTMWLVLTLSLGLIGYTMMHR